MIYPNCNAEIQDNSNFCTHCGATVAAQYASPRGLDIGKVVGDTFTLYMRHFGIMCFVGLLVVGIPAAIQICQVNMLGQVAAPVPNENPVQAPFALLSMIVFPFGFLFILSIVQCYLAIVAARQCLHIARGGTGFREDMMFPPVMMFLNMLGMTLIVTCLIMALAIPGAIVAGIVVGVVAIAAGGMAGPPSPMMGAVIACLVVLVILPPIFWLSIRLWLAIFYIVDKNTDCIDALKKSWSTTSGNFWALLGTAILLMCPIFCWMFVCHGLVYAMNGDIAMMQTTPGILLWTAGSVPIALFAQLGGVLAYFQLTGQPT